MTFIVKDTSRDTERECSSRNEAEETKNDMISLGAKPENIEIVGPKASDGGTDDIDAEVIKHTGDGEEETEKPAQTHQVENMPQEKQEPQEVETEVLEPAELAKDPIAWLEGINNDFVNTIKGTPAISKQGFRFIQSQFGITTESEVVETFDDPVGVVVWAKAELPDGQAAEAHGEGYLTERDVDDNEFVRYGDTRAKNRAISDLTSAGALAVSELTDSE